MNKYDSSNSKCNTERGIYHELSINSPKKKNLKFTLDILQN